MTLRPSTLLAALGAAAVAILALSWSGDLAPARPTDLFASAHAVIGAPLTPVSYAGVARRTTRRATYPLAAAPPPAYTIPAPAFPTDAPAYPVPAPGQSPIERVYYPPECIRVMDSVTGKDIHRCP